MLELLNTKSVLDCISEEEREAHNSELIQLLKELMDDPKYRWIIATYSYVDPAHRHKKNNITTCQASDIMWLLELVDLKNGVDLMRNREGHMVMNAFGQRYHQDGEYHYVETQIRIIPWE